MKAFVYVAFAVSCLFAAQPALAASDLDPASAKALHDYTLSMDKVNARLTVWGTFQAPHAVRTVVSLTTNWTSTVVVSHSQYGEEVSAPSSGLTVQQQLNMYASGWHTQGWWALVFAVAAVLFGAGALLLPRIVRSSGTPGWARAAGASAIIVGLVGALLAVLTIAGVFGGHLTVPASAG